MKRLVLVLLLLAACGQAPASVDVVRDSVVGTIAGISQGVLTVDASDGSHTLGLVETSKIVDISGAQRTVESLKQGQQVRFTVRHLASGLDVVQQLTILPSAQTPSRPSVIEPPEQD